MLLKCKKISYLILQPEYILQESFKIDGKTHRAIKYIADFEYKIGDTVFTEDTKGFLTDVYRIKKKMFLNKYRKNKFIES